MLIYEMRRKFSSHNRASSGNFTAPEADTALNDKSHKIIKKPNLVSSSPDRVSPNQECTAERTKKTMDVRTSRGTRVLKWCHCCGVCVSVCVFRLTQIWAWQKKGSGVFTEEKGLKGLRGLDKDVFVLFLALSFAVALM